MIASRLFSISIALVATSCYSHQPPPGWQQHATLGGATAHQERRLSLRQLYPMINGRRGPIHRRNQGPRFATVYELSEFSATYDSIHAQCSYPGAAHPDARQYALRCDLFERSPSGPPGGSDGLLLVQHTCRGGQLVWRDRELVLVPGRYESFAGRSPSSEVVVIDAAGGVQAAFKLEPRGYRLFAARSSDEALFEIAAALWFTASDLGCGLMTY
jgi:hypothetical protein